MSKIPTKAVIIEYDSDDEDEQLKPMKEVHKPKVEIEILSDDDETFESTGSIDRTTFEEEEEEKEEHYISKDFSEKEEHETKRKLTEEEMYNITDFLEIDPEKDWETSIAVMENVRNEIFSQLKDIEIYPSKISKLKSGIKNDYETSKLDPGTAVGCDASLSIGEPTTQQSAESSTRVVLRQGKKTFNTTIGEFIDKGIENAWMIIVEDNDSEIVPMNAFDETEIMSVSKDEKISWHRITELSKHNVNGDLVKIKTSSGRSVTCTLSHSFLTRDKYGVVPILGKDLLVGHRVPVIFKTPEIKTPIDEIEFWEEKTFKLTKNVGEFIGIFIAEGNTCKSSYEVTISTVQPYYKDVSYKFFSDLGKKAKTVKRFETILGSKKKYNAEYHSISYVKLSKWLRKNIGTYSYNKQIPDFLYGCKKEFIASVIRSMFDGDGNFHGARKSIKYHSTSKNLIEQTAFLLSYFNIFCTYQVEKEEDDSRRELWVLLIFGPKYGKIFYNEIGTNNEKNRYEMESYINDEDGRNFIDQVPNCAELINKIGRGLKLPGASRNYGRWIKKEHEGLYIGKNTLKEYVKLFTEKNEEKKEDFGDDISLLQQAVDADVIWDKIVELEIIKADPSVKVYDFSVSVNETFATQSGILVHNTLNSLDYKEHIVVKNSLGVTSPKIGEFVDKYMEEYKKTKKVYDGVTEYVDISHLGLEVPCVDENGKMSYKLIEAVTRHPPPNGEKLLEVTTQTGRKVIATKAKSFLQRIDNKIVGVEGRNLKIGDRLPVTIHYPRPLEKDRLTKINLDRYLKKDRFVFGSELWKMRDVKESYNSRRDWKNNRDKEEMKKYSYGGRNSRWWTENYEIEFTVPYNRCDTAMDALEGKQKEYIGEEVIKKNCVYEIKRSRKEKTEIPEEIILDNDFGFVVGAYIAEGHCSNTGYQCIISNNDKDYMDRIEKWCKKLNIGYHIQIQHDKNFAGATSTDLRMHSTVIVEWFKNMCGNYSQNKHIPDFALLANDDFIKGMIDGYFSGDGSVGKNGNIITCSSVSECLIDELMMVLGMYDIFCYKSSIIRTKNNIGSKNILPAWQISIQANNINRYRDNFTFTVGYKQERLNIKKNHRYNYYIDDYIPGIKCDDISNCLHRDKIDLLIDDKLNSDDGFDLDSISILNQAVSSQVLFDKIISIEEIESSTPLVYDLTIFETRNFTGRDGLADSDTFHLAGVSAANVTLGVPRTNEILNASKNQKNNVLTISLNPSLTDLTNLQEVRDKCRFLFEEKYLDQCVVEHEIISMKYNSLSEDELIWYNLFDTLYTTHYRNCEWCIRLKLNKLVMYQYKLTTETVARCIEKEYKDCRCVFSPDEIAIIDVYVDTTNVDTPSVIMATKKKSGKRGKDEKKKKKRDDDGEEREQRTLINDDNKDLFFVSRVALDYILDIKLGGVEGIMKCYYQQDNKTKCWKVESSGTNMREVMNNTEVDFRYVVSNNMWEIFGILGIEAARKFLVSEISAVVSFGGTFIDPVHPALLADSMTSTGTITSVNRYGISKSVVGVLTPASFEQSHQNMLDAPAKGVTDDLSTVSADIIVAKHVKIGTGYFGLFMNQKKLKKMSIPIPKPLPMIMEDVKNIPEDKRFPTSNSVFKSGGTGKVVEKVPPLKPAMEYVDF